jgi:hypothetical protein
MILFIIFFTGHLVTGHLVTKSLGDKLFVRAQYNYAKFHYNHHRVQMVTWSLVTWSLSHLENFPYKIVASMILLMIFFTWSLGHWSLGHLVTYSLGDKPLWAGTQQLCKILLQLVTWSLVTWSLITWSLSHLVINLPGGAHNKYSKFHDNRISVL